MIFKISSNEQINEITMVRNVDAKYIFSLLYNKKNVSLLAFVVKMNNCRNFNHQLIVVMFFHVINKFHRNNVLYLTIRNGFLIRNFTKPAEIVSKNWYPKLASALDIASVCGENDSFVLGDAHQSVVKDIIINLSYRIIRRIRCKINIAEHTTFCIWLLSDSIVIFEINWFLLEENRNCKKFPGRFHNI